MAAIAIGPDWGLEPLYIPPESPTRRERRKPRDTNPGRFLSQTVRSRRHGQRWWQPSRSTFKARTPRAVELTAALREELDDKALAPEEFWAMSGSDVEEYLQARASEERILIEKRHIEILDGIEREHAKEAYKLAELARLRKFMSLLEGLRVELAMATSQAEIDELEERIRQTELEIHLERLALEIYSPYATAA